MLQTMLVINLKDTKLKPIASAIDKFEGLFLGGYAILKLKAEIYTLSAKLDT